MENDTLAYDLPPLPSYTLEPQPDLLPWISDANLALFAPIAAYWIVSLFFHWIDVNDYLPQYRLHTPEEITKRNHVSRWDVFRDVIIQQLIQTAFGLLLTFFDPPTMQGKEEYDVAVWAQRIRFAQGAVPVVLSVLGVDAGALAQRLATSYPNASGIVSGGHYPWLRQAVKVDGGMSLIVPAFAAWEKTTAYAIYWAIFPVMQFLVAITLIDTWQYFLHRAMHMNKWLYTSFHSRHHRLYVPYAYGALYNHPFEGFLLDTLGAGVAYLLTGMTTRQSIFFYTFSTIKTVDDHCGYALPWDPLQHVTSNNASYHDIHHQSWGIKTNFSQPFFTFWDALLGTMWKGGDVSARYAKSREAARVAALKEKESSTAQSDKPYEKTDPATAPPAATNAIPRVPAGKATKQAIASREQVLEDPYAGGPRILAEEAEEEHEAQISLRRSPRKRTTSSSAGLKGLSGRVNTRLQGRGGGVLHTESSR